MKTNNRRGSNCREVKTRAQNERGYVSIRLRISPGDRDRLRKYSKANQVSPETVLETGMKHLGIV